MLVIWITPKKCILMLKVNIDFLEKPMLTNVLMLTVNIGFLDANIVNIGFLKK